MVTDDLDIAFAPLGAYEQEYLPKYTRASAELFDQMVANADIDVDNNEVLNLRIAKASDELTAQKSILRKQQWQRVLAIIGGILSVAAPFIVQQIAISHGQFLLWYGWLIAGVIAAALAGLAFRAVYLLTPLVRNAKAQVAETTDRRDNYIAEARSGLAPLQQQYHWNMLDAISTQSVPGLALERYVPISKQDDLAINYDLMNPIGPDSSVLATQGGTFHGNPFVIFHTLNFLMGWKTYTGSIVITWQEVETYTDSNGRPQTRVVTRTQVLTAAVDKPFPEYRQANFVVFGTENTPSLSFSRTPSKLSKLGETKQAQRKVERTVKKLEKKSRDINPNNNFTVMANRDFAALFQATDRNDEIQYRVLFTPVAQQQMVELMRDNRLGYGDNFSFQKHGPIITVHPQHLSAAELVAVPKPPPDAEENWNLAAQKTGFQHRSIKQFKDRYFALAPIFAIPLLHEPRTTPAVPFEATPSSWEQEAVANQLRGAFRHPESITDDILKTRLLTEQDGVSTVEVTAAGFRGVERVDYIPQFGRDNRMHMVPVPWVEYIPVSNTNKMTLTVPDGVADPPGHSANNGYRGIIPQIV